MTVSTFSTDILSHLVCGRSWLWDPVGSSNRP